MGKNKKLFIAMLAMHLDSCSYFLTKFSLCGISFVSIHPVNLMIQVLWNNSPVIAIWYLKNYTQVLLKLSAVFQYFPSALAIGPQPTTAFSSVSKTKLQKAWLPIWNLSHYWRFITAKFYGYKFLNSDSFLNESICTATGAGDWNMDKPYRNAWRVGIIAGRVEVNISNNLVNS